MKYRPDIAETIRSCGTSREAFDLARRYKDGAIFPLSLRLARPS